MAKNRCPAVAKQKHPAFLPFPDICECHVPSAVQQQQQYISSCSRVIPNHTREETLNARNQRQVTLSGNHCL